MTLTVLVLAKTPEPGRSKTRLAPAFGLAGAARLAAAALADTLDAVAAAPVDRRLLVLDGDRGAVAVPPGVRVVPQARGSHAERIIAAFEEVRGPALLIGMDTPQVTPALLALDTGSPADAWLGLAEDGGWWALGLRRARRDARRLVAGVPMSSSSTGELQRGRIVSAGLRLTDLPVLRDVDEPADALAVAAAAPWTRFAAAVGALPLAV